MNKFVIAMLVLPLTPVAASAQTGNAAAGKAYWDRGSPAGRRRAAIVTAPRARARSGRISRAVD